MQISRVKKLIFRLNRPFRADSEWGSLPMFECKHKVVNLKSLLSLFLILYYFHSISFVQLYCQDWGWGHIFSTMDILHSKSSYYVRPFPLLYFFFLFKLHKGNSVMLNFRRETTSSDYFVSPYIRPIMSSNCFLRSCWPGPAMCSGCGLPHQLGLRHQADHSQELQEGLKCKNSPEFLSCWFKVLHILIVFYRLWFKYRDIALDTILTTWR